MSKNNLEYTSKQEEAQFSDKYSRINKRNNAMASSSSKKSPFLGIYDDMSVVEELGIQDKAAKSLIDSKLLMLLEFFRQLHIRKREVIKKIFPDHLHDDFVEIFNKFTDMCLLGRSEKLNQNQITTRSLQRSFSVGSPRPRSINGDESPLRLERFKVRTVITSGGAQGDRGDTKSGGSGGSK